MHIASMIIKANAYALLLHGCPQIILNKILMHLIFQAYNG